MCPQKQQTFCSSSHLTLCSGIWHCWFLLPFWNTLSLALSDTKQMFFLIPIAPPESLHRFILLYLTIKFWSSQILVLGLLFHSILSLHTLSLHTQCLLVLLSMTLPQWPVNYTKMYISSPDPSDGPFLLGISKALYTQNIQSWIHDLPPQSMVYKYTLFIISPFMKPPYVKCRKPENKVTLDRPHSLFTILSILSPIF